VQVSKSELISFYCFWVKANKLSHWDKWKYSWTSASKCSWWRCTRERFPLWTLSI